MVIDGRYSCLMAGEDDGGLIWDAVISDMIRYDRLFGSILQETAATRGKQ
jgi:hypothetical protein